MIQILLQYLISLPAIIIGLTFHEYAHGRVAYFLGDQTAYLSGRLTLNPLSHLDPLGFIMLLFFHFGWAKPVPVNPNYFVKTSRKTGMILVAAAGPVMNLLLAAASMVLLRISYPFLYGETGRIIFQLITPLITVNLILAVFNLIPIPPLDGSKVLAGLLPNSAASFIYSFERYGSLILLVLVVFNIAGAIIWPVVNVIYGFLYRLIF